MFRLPVCPHCGTVYRYKEVRQALRKKKITCYHCKKEFAAKRFPYLLVVMMPLAAVCVAVNIALLSRMKELELIPLFAATLVFILIGWAIEPFFVKFK